MATKNLSLSLLFFILLLFSSLTLSVVSTALKRSARANPTIAQFLNTHNAVRKRHRVPPLRWDPKLANYARWYANQRRSDCALVHSDSDFGENIFWGKGNKWKPYDAVKAWANQEAYFNYRNNTCLANKECLHYTQVVWRSTKNVGCAQIKCNSGDTYIVCDYYPHGNVIGQWPY